MSETTVPSFSIDQVIKQAWEILKQKWAFLVGLFAVVGGVGAGVTLVENVVSMTVQAAVKSNDSASLLTIFPLLVSLVAQLIIIMMHIGLMKVAIKVVRGETAEIKELFSGKKYLIQYILASAVTSLITMFGLLLLIVPGVIWSLKYMFTTLVVVDEGLGFADAMAKSALMTQGIKWKLLGFSLAMAGLNFLGCLPLFLGLIITLPLTWLATYVLYTKLKEQTAVGSVVAA
jgi:uncharacterized membrane protein